jgi:PAS domain S-box-containing protein
LDQPRHGHFAVNEEKVRDYRKLLENMEDAVIFIDSSLKILHWNRAAERMTGIPAGSIEHKQWAPSLVNLRDERSKLIREDQCPVTQAIESGVQTLRRLSIVGRNGQRVELAVTPEARK